MGGLDLKFVFVFLDEDLLLDGDGDLLEDCLDLLDGNGEELEPPRFLEYFLFL